MKESSKVSAAKNAVAYLVVKVLIKEKKKPTSSFVHNLKNFFLGLVTLKNAGYINMENK